ncbi:hypothetical protein ACXEIJ_005054 [Klebsiella quasipneumoniae]
MKAISVAAIISFLCMSPQILGQSKPPTTGTEAKVASQAIDQDIEYIITELNFNYHENMTIELYK